MMFVPALILALFAITANGATLNLTCPTVTPKTVDLKQLDGTWYVYEATVPFLGLGPLNETECATFEFNHKSDNVTELSHRLIHNKTAVYYNGTADLVKDNALQINLDTANSSYNLLTVDYNKQYAVLFHCTTSDATSISYELLKLVKEQHPSPESIREMNEAQDSLKLIGDKLNKFNNTEESCKTNDAKKTQTTQEENTESASQRETLAGQSKKENPMGVDANKTENLKPNDGNIVTTSSIALISAIAISILSRLF